MLLMKIRSIYLIKINIYIKVDLLGAISSVRLFQFNSVLSK